MEDLIILHEDNHVIVVLKPQNVPTCEDASGDEDLLTMVKAYIKKTYDKPGNAYAGLVHRLDRPTGGVMVFAKSSKAAARLSEQMKTGDFEKRYYTVLAGIPREEKATLVHYMKKNAVNNMVYVCAPTTEGAKRAELDYAVLEKNGDISLAEVRLHTGRSHQIRVQMNAIGTPRIRRYALRRGEGEKRLSRALGALSRLHASRHQGAAGIRRAAAQRPLSLDGIRSRRADAHRQAARLKQGGKFIEPQQRQYQGGQEIRFFKKGERVCVRKRDPEIDHCGVQERDERGHDHPRISHQGEGKIGARAVQPDGEPDYHALAEGIVRRVFLPCGA